MNHGPDFWSYYRTLKREVYALQRANYFGDGRFLYRLVLRSRLLTALKSIRVLVVWSSTSGWDERGTSPRGGGFARIFGMHLPLL